MRGWPVGLAAARGCGTDFEGLFTQVRQLSLGRPIATVELLVIDGGTSKVRAVVDQSDWSHWFDQAVTGLECGLPTLDFAGKLCLTTTGVEWYQSTRPPAYWVWGSDGSGADMYFAAANLSAGGSPQVLFGTQNISVVTPGFSVQIDLAAGNWATYVCHATNYAVTRSDASVFPTGVPKWACFSYWEGSSPEVVKRVGGTTLFSGASASAPTASPPINAFRLFASPSTGSFRFTGRWRSTLFFPRLTDRSVVDAWMAQDTGIAA